MNAVLQTLAIAVAAALVAAALHHLIQRTFGSDVLAKHNDVAGFIYSGIGVIFAVVLGFVVIVVWEKYDTVRGYVDDEVAAAIDLYHVTDGFPQGPRDRIRADLVAYAHAVVNREWATMARGAMAQGGSPEIEDVAREVSSLAPSNASQQNAQQEALHQVLRMFDARRQRIRANEPSVPPLLWFALYSGAAVTLGFTFIFGVKNRFAQLLMTAALASLIAIMFVVIQGLDTPFRGASALSPAGWEYFDEHLPVLNAEDNPGSPHP